MSEDILLKFGKNIRKHRKRLDITQEELADCVELHRTYIGAVERGERNVSLENIVAIARGLNTTPSKLLEGIL